MTGPVKPKDPSEGGRVDRRLDAPETVHHPAKRPGHEAPAIDIPLLWLLVLIIVAILMLHNAPFFNPDVGLTPGSCLFRRRLSTTGA